ncbi:MAG: hypothetical protein WD534_01045 [Phycisphaeraceae bacterium]
MLVALLTAGTTLADEPDGLELSQASGMAGVPAYQAERWGLVRSVVNNRTGQVQTPLVVHAVGDHRHVQFAHRLWLPPHTRRTLLTPVMPLSPPRGDERSIPIQTWLIDDADGRERAAPPSDGLLLASRGSFQTGMMSDRDDDLPIDMAASLREAAGLGPGAAYVSDDGAPTLPAAWGVLDALIISRTPELNPAQFDALRQWVLAGGRLWIMLDKVDPDFARRLLGDAWGVSPVDRVHLDAFTLESTGQSEPLAVQYDYGYELRRVHAPQMHVTHRVQGYPAAAWQRVGAGTLLVTTLHAGAWLDAEGGMTPPLEELTWFFESAEPGVAEQTAAAREAMSGQAGAQIGYTILSRTPVFVVLGLFAVALLLGGVMLARGNRLEWIGLVGVAMALLTAGVLVGMGKLRQSEHPMTLATADFVQPVRDRPDGIARGVASVFRPDHAPGQVTFTGPGEAIAFPTDARRASERTRMVWHGLERWEFPDFTLPSGAARSFEVDRMVALDRPLGVTARLTDAGLAGQVEGLAGQSLDDALVALPNGRMAVRLDAEGRFTAGLDDRLTGGQYVRAVSALGTLGQAQLSRQTAYRKLLGQGGFSTEPMLMGWTDAPDAPLEMSYDAVHRGQRLVALPLRLQAPEAGERVTVPAPMMAMHPFRDGRASGMSVYDVNNREWVSPISQPMELLMRFDPPEALRSLDIDAAVLELQLDAPGWEYEVLRYRDGQAEAVHADSDPAGRLRIELDHDQAPFMHETGVVVVGLRMSPQPGTDHTSGWSLQRMDLTIQGVAR